MPHQRVRGRNRTKEPCKEATVGALTADGLGAESTGDDNAEAKTSCACQSDLRKEGRKKEQEREEGSRRNLKGPR